MLERVRVIVRRLQKNLELHLSMLLFFFFFFEIIIVVVIVMRLKIRETMNTQIQKKKKINNHHLCFKFPAINALPKSYLSLICWLVSLIPPDFVEVKQWLQAPEEGALNYPDGFPPFHVIGLQQLLVDGGLCLAIAICPSPVYMLHKDDRRDRLLKKGKVRNESVDGQGCCGIKIIVIIMIIATSVFLERLSM